MRRARARRLAALVFALGGAGAAAEARAQEPASAPPASEEPARKEPVAVRRSGFLVGTSFGIGPGASNGFPNDAKKVNRLDFYTESGVGLGTYGALWLGGALTDGFSFGVGAGGGTIHGDGVKSPGGGIFFQADAFPLFTLGDAWRDVGVQLQAGTGGATTETEDEDILIDGAGAAYVSAAVFWEGLELWRIRSGPYVGIHYMWSDSVRRPMALFGMRTVLYTGP